MTQTMKSWRWFLVLLLLSSPAVSDEPEPYRTGVDAFKAGKYEQALTFFKQSLLQGNQTPGLYYNLGVTFYKTGKYDQATDVFQRLVENPEWGSLALYNLGLTAEAQGQRQSAIDYYSRAQKKSGDSPIASLAALRLKALLPDTGKKEARKWYGIASVGAGYDDNAMLASDDAVEEVGEEEDWFGELYTAGGRYLTGGWKNGVRLDGGVYARLYRDETAYNALVIFAGISHDRQYDLWRTRAGLTVDADFDDDGHYATTPALELAAERGFTDYRLKIYDTSYWVEAYDTYSYLTGLKNRCGGELAYRIPGGHVSAGCEVEYNDRDDLYNEDEFFSYSPIRGKLNAELDFRQIGRASCRERV
jgi:tetratricopeptide (TPR) repeat protein